MLDDWLTSQMARDDLVGSRVQITGAKHMTTDEFAHKLRAVNTTKIEVTLGARCPSLTKTAGFVDLQTVAIIDRVHCILSLTSHRVVILAGYSCSARRTRQYTLRGSSAARRRS